MTTTTHPASITKPATDALTDLVITARSRARACRVRSETTRAAELDNIAKTLDGARTRLVQDGPEYLDAAWAFVNAGRTALARLAKKRPIR